MWFLCLLSVHLTGQICPIIVLDVKAIDYIRLQYVMQHKGISALQNKFSLMWKCLRMKRSTGVVNYRNVSIDKQNLQMIWGAHKHTRTQRERESEREAYTHSYNMVWTMYAIALFFWVTYVTPKLMTVEYLMEIYGEFVQNFWQWFALFVFVFVHGYVWVNVYQFLFPFRAQCIFENVYEFDLQLKN